jgi:hypothetical protein
VSGQVLWQKKQVPERRRAGKLHLVLSYTSLTFVMHTFLGGIFLIFFGNCGGKIFTHTFIVERKTYKRIYKFKIK